MSQVTDPVMLDTTGQDIVAKLQDVIDAINGGTINPLTVTQNGTYTPSGTTLGYGPVTVNVGDGGGGITILSGTDAPTAAQGDNGDIYLEYFSFGANITNVRMTIYDVRTSGSDTQVAEVQLYDANGSAISWGAGTGTSNGNVYSSSQTPDKAFDNITNDKWYTDSKPSLQSPIWIDFAPNTPIPANSIKGWGWYTGNDSTNRDPKTFDLQMSFDGGNTYLVIDSVVDVSVTTNRNALAYTKAIADGAVVAAYAKVNGAWQALIGTDIDDINLGS